MTDANVSDYMDSFTQRQLPEELRLPTDHKDLSLSSDSLCGTVFRLLYKDRR